MSLPTRGEIRSQLFIGGGFAVLVVMVAISATPFFLEFPKPGAAPSTVSIENAEINWDDVNLSTGTVESPETTVNTARSKMLSDFEAR